jgi:hypothetical protein
MGDPTKQQSTSHATWGEGRPGPRVGRGLGTGRAPAPARALRQRVGAWRFCGGVGRRAGAGRYLAWWYRTCDPPAWLSSASAWADRPVPVPVLQAKPPSAPERGLNGEGRHAHGALARVVGWGWSRGCGSAVAGRRWRGLSWLGVPRLMRACGWGRWCRRPRWRWLCGGWPSVVTARRACPGHGCCG